MSINPIEKIETLIGKLMRQMKIPGLAVGVIMGGKPIYSQGFGARNIENNLPMTSDTLFGIASMSKSFCALAIMQLYEQGKLDLNDPVSKHINFKLGKKENPITIHHLLSHSSGVPELDATNASSDKSGFIPMSSEKDYLLYLNQAEDELPEDPGKVFMYNNDMYTILGFIIEKITKQKFADYVKEHILNPLDMKRSTYYKEKFLKDDNVITGYIRSEEGGSIKKREIRNDPLEYACGGIYSSINEMMHYMIGLMNGGSFNGNHFIQQESLNKMWTSYITPPKIYGKGYGYGLEVNSDFFGVKLVGHGGNVPTSGGYFAMVPEKKIGAIVGQIPNPSLLPDALVKGILAVLLGKEMEVAIPVLETYNKLDKLIGKYKAYGLAEMEITLEGMGILQAKVFFSKEEPPYILPLIIDDLDQLKFSIPFALPDMGMSIQGKIDEKTGKVHIRADRYYFHKIN